VRRLRVAAAKPRWRSASVSEPNLLLAAGGGPRSKLVRLGGATGEMTGSTLGFLLLGVKLDSLLVSLAVGPLDEDEEDCLVRSRWVVAADISPSTATE
jgi:hypothetical protein